MSSTVREQHTFDTAQDTFGYGYHLPRISCANDRLGFWLLLDSHQNIFI